MRCRRLVRVVLPAAGLLLAQAALAADFRLPATFAGLLPCADCAGIAHTLTLREDGLYRLRRSYLGKPGEAFNEVGRWAAETSSARLLLRSGRQRQMFAVQDASTLRLLDPQGQPIRSALNSALRRTVQLDPISESLQWRGEVVYQADAASVTDCGSDLRWPLVMTAEYLALERSYLAQRSAPGAALVMRFEGRLMPWPTMDGPPREQMVVDRFIAAEPGLRCDSTVTGTGEGGDQSRASLTNTYWKLVEIGGVAVSLAAGQSREVRITLASDGARLSGFTGCNNLVGGYRQNGAELRLTGLASSRMACVGPAMALEDRVLQALTATTGQRVTGQQLVLLAGDQVLARFEAVYLR